MISYKINSWSFNIEEVEVIRWTKSFVIVMWNGRERRESSSNYFKSREDAKEAIIKRESANVDRIKRQLDYATEKLNEAKKELL